MSMFEDEVRLLISIIKNYNRYIVSVESAEKSTGMFVQYSQLKSIMDSNGHGFVVSTRPMFGRFKFLYVSFSKEFHEKYPVLKELGFILEDGISTYFFVPKEECSSYFGERRIGVVGTGRSFDVEEVVRRHFEKLGIGAD